ncbi:hypothetical protein DVH05_022939 [Phytophthora capsici]|nr:hypothetical protein DVH05_014848 [Phytophthora capsici]KAG1693838.1 hypothetical protein DVH05_022939 [Phytophthora capsici]
MAKEGINGVFGKPKVLRSKLVKASDELEEDAQTMEARLLQLRVNMLEEKKKRDAVLPLKHAGNRWRSAREDRGSMRLYARDVQQKKAKKKNKKENTDSIGSKKLKTKKSSKLDILSPSTVEQWTVQQVLEWLRAIGLEEFQSGFEFHLVTGKKLLGMSSEGYEKLGVYKLSVRNRLLAEMEQIRAQQMKEGNGLENGNEPAEIIDPKLRDTHLISSPLSKSAAKTHWSHVSPLSETSIASGDGQVPVNLADGEFNEDASHASFMKALLEWRESDSKEVSKSNQQDDEWVNPIFNGGIEEAQETQKTGGALLEGTYNEDDAHNSFQEALMAWRNGGSDSATRSATPVEQTESGCTPGKRRSCWQCYRVVQVEGLVHDGQTDKSFCGSTCQHDYHELYARFYTSSS